MDSLIRTLLVQADPGDDSKYSVTVTHDGKQLREQPHTLTVRKNSAHIVQIGECSVNDLWDAIDGRKTYSRDVAHLGSSLFSALFGDVSKEVGNIITSFLDKPPLDGLLRIILRFPPELHRVPWEMMALAGDSCYTETENNFLALRTSISLVRRNKEFTPRPMTAWNKPRIIAAAADTPTHQTQHDKFKKLLEHIEQNYDVSLNGGQFRNDIFSTRDCFSDAMNSRVDLFCFYGHGEDSALLFRQGPNSPPDHDQQDKIGAFQLGRFLNNTATAIFCCCKSAHRSDTSPTQGALAAGCAAVVAMQGAVSDENGCNLLDIVLKKLCEKESLEKTLVEVRNKCKETTPHRLEWAYPVVYLHTNDERLVPWHIRKRPTQEEKARATEKRKECVHTINSRAKTILAEQEELKNELLKSDLFREKNAKDIQNCVNAAENTILGVSNVFGELLRILEDKPNLRALVKRLALTIVPLGCGDEALEDYLSNDPENPFLENGGYFSWTPELIISNDPMRLPKIRLDGGRMRSDGLLEHIESGIGTSDSHPYEEVLYEELKSRAAPVSLQTYLRELKRSGTRAHLSVAEKEKEWARQLPAYSPDGKEHPFSKIKIFIQKSTPEQSHPDHPFELHHELNDIVIKLFQKIIDLENQP